MKQILKRKI